MRSLPLLFTLILFASVATAQTTLADLPPEAQSSISAAMARNLSGTHWKDAGDLIGYDTQQYSFFGTSAAASGNTVVVGAPGYADDMGDVVPGLAYVFVKPAGGWKNMIQTAILSASDGGSKAGNNFGFSVAIVDNTIFVGAPNFALGTFPDEVYVFEKPASGWQDMTENARLSAGNSLDSTSFGTSLAVSSSGDTLVIGAVYAEYSGVPMGAAYVFLKPETGWQTTSHADAKFKASDRAANDRFGGAVAIDGDTIVAGANGYPAGAENGAVYVYSKPSGGWQSMTQTAKLTAAHPTYEAFLGISVSILGNTIAAGAPYGTKAKPAGTVYIFTEPESGWANGHESARLTENSSVLDGMGWSVTLTPDLLLGGAPYATVNQNQDQGAAYVYLKPASGWQSTSKYSARLFATYGEPNDNFGVSVAASGSTFFAGAPDSFNGDDVGLAYVFAPQ
jgi:hypothetical protein